MKSILGFLSACFITMNAAAQTPYTSCTNGPVEKMGDNHIQIDLLEDGIAFYPYETSFVFDASEVNYSNGVLSIVNKTAKVSSEGQELNWLINALLIFDDKAKILQVAISYDNGPFKAYQLACVEK